MKNKLYLIIFLLLSLFMVVGCGKDEESKVEVESNKREITNEEKESLMEIVNKLTYMDYYNKDIVPINLTNQEVLRISYEILAMEGKAVSGKLKFSDLENTAMNYLGFGLEPENLVCDTHYNIQDAAGADILVYNVNTGVYSNNPKHLGHGAGGLRTEVYNKFVEGYEDNGTYTIVVNKIFSELLGDVYDSDLSYYSTYSDAIGRKNELFKSKMVNSSKFDEYSNDLVEYTYVFKLKEDNYVLSSYKRG